MTPIRILRKEQQINSQWSGGTTTQLYIYPEGSSYAGRDFEVRISSATVNNGRSIFTHLPGYWRVLMVLEGELKISHDASEEIILKKFQSYRFNGSQHTESEGAAIDFNLMTNTSKPADVSGLVVTAGEKYFLPKTENEMRCIYVFKGKLKIAGGENRVEVTEGDFVYCEDCGKEVELSAVVESEIVVVCF